MMMKKTDLSTNPFEVLIPVQVNTLKGTETVQATRLRTLASSP